MNEYVNPELLILVPLLNMSGAVLKNSDVKNKHIPLILTGISIFLSTLYIVSIKGFTFLRLFDGIVQGVLVASSSVYLNQLVKQANKED